MDKLAQQIRTELTEIVTLYHQGHYKTALGCLIRIGELMSKVHTKIAERSQANGQETGHKTAATTGQGQA